MGVMSFTAFRSHRWSFPAALTLALLTAAPLPGEPPRGRALANVTPDGVTARDAVPSQLVEEVQFRGDRGVQSAAGRVLVEAADGGLLLETSDGVLWAIQGNAIVSRRQTATPFRPLASAELGEKLVAELPPGFRVHTTPHFVICYDTSREFAEWTSSLFERLYKAFTNYWDRKGLELHEPEFPLAAIVFADRAAYAAAAREELGGAAGNIVGYYSLQTNRVNMYDLTGVESLRGQGNRRGSLREINQMLSQPAAVPLVATIVHEATHQITFNCGLQARFADVPLWQCEGMAMYFEAPDLTSSRGWRGIGRINYPRLETFRRNLPNWQRGSLEQLVADNRRFRDSRAAVAAYADAWALNYFLIKYRSDDYVAYLKSLARKRPLMQDDRDARLADFERCFGDWHELEEAFLKQMSRIQ
jgi:Protein of unknown function (DUF1570)